MNKDELKKILEGVASGELSCEDAIVKIKCEPYEDLGFAKIDTHRSIRQGAAEVIYSAGKTKEQILKICQKMLLDGEKSVLITRLSKEGAEYLNDNLPLFYDEISKIAVAG
ncbi:MAG: 1-(5-phosphoribosyl)-5-amino-4-imidazole-carboxylate carboxylase, partial [Eubacterium sp.]